MSELTDDIRRMVTTREIGGSARRTWRVGRQDRFHNQLSLSTRCVRSWDPRENVDNTHHGGIFNFGFSTDGALLAAACERRSVLLFDPRNAQLIGVKNDAHTDCVNCVKFMDTRTFVTCSDDTTVCLWDVRNMKQKICTLKGHSNWVKNIEYVPSGGFLLTSGFDGSIYLWDINRYCEDGVTHQRLFHTNGLMRSKITPDGSKLVLATTGGYLMVIHDLDLPALAKDLAGFKPNMYHVMQNCQWSSMQAYNYHHLFTAARNRVELISDFPAQDDAGMVTSLELHPQGWCAVSRNTSSDENTEWTCVHDIQGTRDDVVDLDQDESSGEHPMDQPDMPSESDSCEISTDETISPSGPTFVTNVALQGVSGARFRCRATWVPPSERTPPGSGLHIRAGRSRSRSPVRSRTSSPHRSRLPERGRSPPRTREEENGRHSAVTEDQNSGTNTSNTQSAYIAMRPLDGIQSVHVGANVTLAWSGSHRGDNTVMLLGRHPQYVPRSDSPAPRKIHVNIPRMTHYIEEPNVGRGFIKEVCFTNDGRFLCSPFAFGVRILAFNSRCQELCDCVPNKPAVLHEVTSNMSHGNVVVAVNCSPTECLMVSGCLNGKVDFHQPVL